MPRPPSSLSLASPLPPWHLPVASQRLATAEHEEQAEAAGMGLEIGGTDRGKDWINDDWEGCQSLQGVTRARTLICLDGRAHDDSAHEASR